MTSEPGKQCTQQAHEQMHQPGHTSIPRTVSEGPHSSFLAEMADSPSNARTNRAIHIIACLVVSGLKSNQLQQAVDSMRSHTARVPVNCEPIVDVTKHWQVQQLPGDGCDECANSVPCYDGASGTERHTLVEGHPWFACKNVCDACSPFVRFSDWHSPESRINICFPQPWRRTDKPFMHSHGSKQIIKEES